jgi:hypothetical protein
MKKYKLLVCVSVIAGLASCATMQKTVKSDGLFSVQHVSDGTDARLVPIVVPTTDIPADKYAVCKVSFNLFDAGIGHSPRNVKIESCDTNDLTGLMEKTCLKTFPTWKFVAKDKSQPLSETDRYNSVCALKAKQENNIQPEISIADPVGKDAYLPNMDFIKPGMNKQEVISLFRRQPDYISSDRRTLGWAYFITAKDKKFSLRLTFDENDKALGLGEDGLMVVIW